MKRYKKFLQHNYIKSHVQQITKQSYCMLDLYRMNVVIKLFSKFAKIFIEIFKILKYNLIIKTTSYDVVKIKKHCSLQRVGETL